MLGAAGAFIGMSVVAGLLVTAAVTPAIAVTGMAANNSIGVFEGLPEYLNVDQLAQPTTIYAKNGDQDVPLATFYSQNRLPVAFDQISQAAKDAAIAGEDPRFYTHGGVDIQGTVRGVLSTVAGGGVQGGSSITQQYVKNVLLQKCEALPVKSKEQKAKYQQCVDDSTGVSPDRKVKEMKYAIGIEKKYTKDQILVGYLNIAGFGGTVYGIEAAAHYYYNTTAAALTPAQAASLIAIVNEPTSLKIDNPGSETNGAANGYAKNKERRDYILQKMYQYKRLTKAQYEEAVKTPIQPVITPSERGCQTAGGSAYFCDYVQKIILNDPTFGADEDTRTSNFNRGGYKIYTSLDLQLQQVAEETINSYVPASYPKADIGGVLVGVQPGTGRVLYMAQNKKYSQDPEVLNTSTDFSSVNLATDQKYGGSGGFQVGSTYKVFTLAEWLKQGHSLSEPVNANIRTYKSFKDSCAGNWSGTYTPQNDSPGETGIRNAQSATTLSINTAFISMASQVDLCEIKKDAEAFGVHTAKGEPLDTNPASVLGTNYIAPLTMATAFAGIANNGMTCSPIAIDKILDANGKDVKVPQSACTQSVDPAVANTMAKALQGPIQNGTAAGMNRTGKDMLGKTGTTEYNDQLWLVAATTKVAGAYWVGNINNHVDFRKVYPTHGKSPASARTDVMRIMMTAAVGKYGGDDFPAAPDKLTRGVQVAVPDLTGKTPDEAKSILTGLGLDSTDGGPQDSVAPAGTISATDPAPGTQVTKGTAITLFTSNGSLVAVPNVVGQKYGDALATLTAAGFKVKTAGGNSPTATVQAQDPAGNAPAKPGTQVTLTLTAPAVQPTPGTGG
ncbi:MULTISPECIES: transglycosylase domain-containing protein [unclassified Leifsonia]|uniref:transglycosylase domain-containing protein n=1 Tax=unclassified Leifsonia TaxID=2663824 RepID=UPI0003734AD2|nr:MULTISPECIES: transglycosylase domain-containing protein [unclassified Leifsonia]TDQ02745.1 membrane peptidoglycan carboxypeptidase [Leifsonia sp. 115AMFTsu3.1]